MHALVAQTSGLTVKNITLFIFGGMGSIEEDMQRPGVEFRVAIAGPIASFLLAVVAFLLALPLRGSNASAEAVLDYLAVANFLLGGFNLIPGFPLDAHCLLRWPGVCVSLHPARDHRVLHGELLQRPLDGLHRLIPLECSANCQYAGRTAIGSAGRLCQPGHEPSTGDRSGEHFFAETGGGVLSAAWTTYGTCHTG